MKRVFFTIIFVFTLLYARAATLYVDQSAAPGGDGSSWINAFQTIESAVAVAVAGDVILIAEGIYQPTSEIDITVSLTIRGGYPSGGGARDIAANATQVQGDFDPGNLLLRVFDISTGAPTTIEGIRVFRARYGIDTRSNLILNNVQLEKFSSFGVRLSGTTIASCSINNCNFSNFSGTAVTNNAIVTNLSISNTIFQQSGGRAISVDDEVTSFNFSNIIIRNFNTDNRILYFTDNTGSITGLKAYNNTLTSSGSIILQNNANVSISDAEFLNNVGANGATCIQTSDGSLTINNSTFTNNTAIGSGPKSVFNIWDTVFTVTNSYFGNNFAQGTFSGLAEIRADDTDALATFDNCTFFQNSILGSSQQGIIDGSYDTNLLINNCVFDANSSPGQFVLDCFTPSGVTVTNTVFKNHSVGPGTLSIDYVERGTGGGIRVEGNTFINNNNTSVDLGRMTDFTMRDNRFYGNVLVDISRTGPGVITNEYYEGNSNGSRFMTLGDTEIDLRNSIMISTAANTDHRLINSGGNTALDIINCTFTARDFANTNVSVGFNADLASRLRNSIIWSGSNLSQDGFHGNISNLAVRYSLVKGQNPAGAGNLNGNQVGNAPVFVNPQSGDFREQRCSPTVNAGNNAFTGLTLDLNGEPRVVQTTINMGAYEFQGNRNASCTSPALPPCTALTNPVSGQNNVAANTNITWGTAARADGYRISLGTSPGGTELIDNFTVLGSNSYDPPFDLPEGQTIYVTIIPFNETGTAAGCGEESFTIAAPATGSNPPACGTLSAPVNGATGVAVTTDISWNAVPGADGYLISVGTSSGGTDIRDSFDGGNTTIYDLPADLPDNRQIFVTIIPYNSVGNANSCAEASFTTGVSGTAPNCTSLTTPTNGATNVAITTDLSWTAVANADGYFLTVGTTSGGNDILNAFDAGNVTTYNLPTDLPENQQIFVTIVPYNSTGNASGCTEESFTTEIVISDRPFITTWETTTANETITIPTRPFFGTYDYTVDWGDGSVDTNVTGDITHTYVSPGIQTVRITGVFPQIHFNGTAVDRDKILTIEQWGDIEWRALTQAFKGCSRLTITNPSIDVPDLSRVTNMSEVFADATAFNGDITQWDVSTITNMALAFQRASSFNRDIGNWDVSNVVSMNRLFESATVFNQNIGNWDTGNVTSMAVMFVGTNDFNQDIGNWNVSQVTDMNTMFGFATSFNQDIGRWNTANVTNMNQMFLGASAFNQDISGWDVSQVTAMIVMFSGASSFNQNIGGWNVSNVTNMNQMFRNAVAFDQDLSNWNMRNVTDANQMFAGVTLSVPNYEALLIGWNRQNLQRDVRFSGGNSTYCSQEAEDARANMTSSAGWNWMITDGGRGGSSLSFDPVADVTSVNSYVLPAITGTNLTGNERYYTAPDGGGTAYAAGDEIFFADFATYPVRLYLYDTSVCNSAEESFLLTITATSLPACTSLVLPADGATNVPISTDLSWTATSDTNGYLITVGTSSGGNDILDAFDVGNVTIYDLPTDLPANQQIFVTIIPYNTTGNASGCSEESFTTETVATVPNCTSLASPTNAATNVAIATDLSWTAVTNADGYRITVGTTSGAGDILNAVDVGNVTTYDLPTDLPDNQQIFVTIVPYNSTGNASGCSEESFTTETVATVPNCTSLASPANGATNVAIATDLSWTDVAEADGYFLTVGTASGAGNILNAFDVGNVTTYDLPANLPEDQQIFVTIIPYNTTGTASGCNEESFTTEILISSDVPSCTRMTFPVPGFTDVDVNTEISWEAVAEAEGYVLSIGTTDGGTDLVDNLDVGLTTSYQPISELPYDTEIFVTIIPYNTNGDASGCTSQSFTTMMEPVNEVETLYGFSPDGDGINEYWVIGGIETVPDNTVSIYNRWGDLVFQVNGYDNRNRVFRGIANKKTGMGADVLPSGTYFFNIQANGTQNLKKLQGFVVIKR
ncbi:BspA family leucine-rich repeat surface protein [Flavobacteriaceae bacterium M23B6Z8]